MLLMITEILRFLSSTTNNPEQAIIYFKVVNAILMPALSLWFLAFTFYYRGDFSVLSVIVVYLTGLLGGGFIFSNEITVTYDNITQNWNGVYPNSFFLIIAPVIIAAFFRIIQPLLRRIRHLEERSDKLTLVIMSFGIGLVLLWGITSAFTSIEFIRITRPLLISTGWFIWYIASRQNPFFLSTSRANPQRLFINNTSGQLYFSYSFGEDEGTASELLAPLVQAINNMALEILQTDSGVKSFNIGNREVVSVSIGDNYYHLVGINLDDVIRGVFTQFAQAVQPRIENTTTGEYFDLEDEVDEYFNNLIIIEEHTQAIPTIDEDLIEK